jgi:hypothetical protein
MIDERKVIPSAYPAGALAPADIAMSSNTLRVVCARDDR